VVPWGCRLAKDLFKKLQTPIIRLLKPSTSKNRAATAQFSSPLYWFLNAAIIEKYERFAPIDITDKLIGDQIQFVILHPI
jgi:hypothetical protein